MLKSGNSVPVQVATNPLLLQLVVVLAGHVAVAPEVVDPVVENLTNTLIVVVTFILWIIDGLSMVNLLEQPIRCHLMRTSLYHRLDLLPLVRHPIMI
jgi:hypothetical protein